LFVAIDPTLFQVPATDGLAEWLEDRALHSPPEDTHMQVAEIGGVVVVHIWAGIRPPDIDAARHMLRDGAVARLTVHWLGVADGYRRQAVGTRLLEAAEAWSVSRGASAAGFSTYLGALATVTFYERRMGYSQHAVYLRKSLV
jgi:GNAT superfamily N-acetyltransferase